ncbi:hypothetical protein [Amycolatopsis coloradensis]|uniref:hypothetical protein n=1 Tax=Amycolatopsis coloradensis TaxID=76021 RepID=UPI002697B72F
MADRLLDLSAAEDEEPPLTLHATAERLTEDAVLELKRTLLAHQGDTPVRVKLAGRSYALDDYPVAVSPMLWGERIAAT